MIDLLNDFHQGLRVLGGHEKESALTNPKSYNMYFEQQINQKDTKRLASSWFCNAFYDCDIFCLSHWRSCWLEEAEDVCTQTDCLDKPEGCDLSFDFRHLHWCADAIVFVQWLCFYVARCCVLLNCTFFWRPHRNDSVWI